MIDLEELDRRQRGHEMICKSCRQAFADKWLPDGICNGCFAATSWWHEHPLPPSDELPEPRPRGDKDEEDDSTRRRGRARDNEERKR